MAAGARLVSGGDRNCGMVGLGRRRQGAGVAQLACDVAIAVTSSSGSKVRSSAREGVLDLSFVFGVASRVVFLQS